MVKCTVIGHRFEALLIKINDHANFEIFTNSNGYILRDYMDSGSGGF